MDLRHFRHLVAVADELHFARAAEWLGMKHSPLSHLIRNLELELKVAFSSLDTQDVADPGRHTLLRQRQAYPRGY